MIGAREIRMMIFFQERLCISSRMRAARMNLELLAEFCARSEGGESATRTTKKEHSKSIKHMVDKHSRTENMPHIHICNLFGSLPVNHVHSRGWVSYRSEPSFGTTSEAPSASSPGPCDPVYKVTDHLHLGLNLRIGHSYTLKDLEERCKGNDPWSADNAKLCPRGLCWVTMVTRWHPFVFLFSLCAVC